MNRTLERLVPIIALLLIVFGITGLFWSFLPAKRTEGETFLQVIRVPLDAEKEEQNGVLMTPYTVVIESPEILKNGAAASLTFSLLRNDISLPLVDSDRNIYETHNVMVELRPELYGVTVEPAGSISTPIIEGEEIAMTWQVQSTQPGINEGTLWCYMIFYPLDDTQEIQRTAFMIKPLSMKTQNFLGINIRWTAVLAAAALTAGIIIAFPRISQVLHPTQPTKRR